MLSTPRITLRYAVQVAAFGLLYGFVAHVVLAYFAANHVVSIVWPLSGLSIALLLLRGQAYWPGVFIGAFLANLLSGADTPWWVSLSIATGNTLEAVIANLLLTRFHCIDKSLTRPRDYFCLSMAGAISATISAGTGVCSLWRAGYLPAGEVAINLLHWWQGDVLGVTLFTPLILVWQRTPSGWIQKPRRWIKPARLAQGVVCFALAFLCGQIVFLGWFRDGLGEIAKPYWMFLFVSWAAVNFGRHGVLLLIIIIAAQALQGMMMRLDISEPEAAQVELANFWFFLIVLTVQGMVLALITHGRRRDQQELLESEERWKFALEGSGDGVWDWDIPGGRVFLSPLFQEMYGYPEHTIGGTPEDWSRLVHPEHMEEVLRKFQQHIDGEIPTYRDEHRMLCSDGTVKWILDRGIIVRRDASGKPLRMVGTHTDITQRKSAETALQEMNEQLESRVAARTEELAFAKEQAEAATKAKSEFLANMSHEIRTPISTVIGMSHLALNADLNPRQRDYVEKINLSGKHLLDLVDNILDFSAIEAGKIRFEEMDFNLDSVLETVRLMFIEQADNKGIRLQMAIDPPLPRQWRGDPLRLGQILINYVNNAIKFSEKGCVLLRALLVDETADNALLRFEVHDEGIGVEADKQQVLFQSFQQADTSTHRKYGGTGLGLAISRQLAEKMGGETGLASSTDEGSVFWFTVRLKKTSQVATVEAGDSLQQLAPVQPQASLQGVQILVVEDNEFNQQVIRELLQAAGASVRVVGDGLAMLQFLDEKVQASECILMDLQMPVMDGLLATRVIRATPAWANLPVIALTANVWSEDREQCLAAGMDDFISKPVSPANLVAVLANWARRDTSRTRDKKPQMDVTELETLFAADRPRIADLMQRFIGFTRNDLEHLALALEEADLETARQIGHKLKSGARQVGARLFADLCHTLEKLQGHDALKKAALLHRLLQGLLADIEQEVAHYRDMTQP
ncbi:MAG TPA: MASE1 domain-containing protein [Pseudomonadales bacterium]|nr:MASE1 domain-containing protein [Pseudomonadales bacterium]